jgi:hypothetical protein
MLAGYYVEQVLLTDERPWKRGQGQHLEASAPDKARAEELARLIQSARERSPSTQSTVAPGIRGLQCPPSVGPRGLEAGSQVEGCSLARRLLALDISNFAHLPLAGLVCTRRAVVSCETARCSRRPSLDGPGRWPGNFHFHGESPL